MMKTNSIETHINYMVGFWQVLSQMSLDPKHTWPCKLLYLYNVNTSWVDCVQRVQYEYLHLNHSLKKCLHWTKEVNTSEMVHCIRALLLCCDVLKKHWRFWFIRIRKKKKLLRSQLHKYISVYVCLCVCGGCVCSLCSMNAQLWQLK